MIWYVIIVSCLSQSQYVGLIMTLSQRIKFKILQSLQTLNQVNNAKWVSVAWHHLSIINNCQLFHRIIQLITIIESQAYITLLKYAIYLFTNKFIVKLPMTSHKIRKRSPISNNCRNDKIEVGLNIKKIYLIRFYVTLWCHQCVRMLL